MEHTAWTCPLASWSTGSEEREAPRAEPGVHTPLPVGTHFSPPMTSGLLSWEACPPCVPQSDGPTSSAHLSPGETDLQTAHELKSLTAHPDVDTREPAGREATFRPGGRALGAKPGPGRPVRWPAQRAARGTGARGESRGPSHSW